MAEQLTPEEAQLIRDRLDALEAAAAEKHKPWYRDPASALSLVAIIASVITFVISQRSQDVQDIRARKEQLEGLLTNLVSLEADFNSSVSPIADPLKREQMSSLFNTKRLIFLEEAEILMDQLGKNVSTSEYGVLANELSSMSSFKKAEIYYERAVGAAQDDVSRAMALRSLAGFYFLPTQLRDFDRGRQYFQAAVDAVKESQVNRAPARARPRSRRPSEGLADRPGPARGERTRSGCSRARAPADPRSPGSPRHRRASRCAASAGGTRRSSERRRARRPARKERGVLIVAAGQAGCGKVDQPQPPPSVTVRRERHGDPRSFGP